MGLYNIVVGDGHENERGAFLLAVLGNPEVGRFRDAWVEKGEDGEPVIAIHTRTGGGNREAYAAQNDGLAAHPLYLRDEDDSFDSTYATWYFRTPPEHRDALAATAVDPVNMGERWQQAFDRVKSGELRPAETALADQLGAFLTDETPGASRIMEV